MSNPSPHGWLSRSFQCEGGKELMAAKQIQITETDFDKLRDLIDRIALSGKDKKRNLYRKK